MPRHSVSEKEVKQKISKILDFIYRALVKERIINSSIILRERASSQ